MLEVLPWDRHIRNVTSDAGSVVKKLAKVVTLQRIVEVCSMYRGLRFAARPVSSPPPPLHQPGDTEDDEYENLYDHPRSRN